MRPTGEYLPEDGNEVCRASTGAFEIHSTENTSCMRLPNTQSAIGYHSLMKYYLQELRDLVPLDVSSSAPTRSRRHGEFEYFERHDLETLLFLRRPLCKEAKQELIFSSDWLNDTENSGGFIQEIIESPLYDHFAFIQLNSWQEQGSLKIWKIPQNGRSQEVIL